MQPLKQWGLKMKQAKPSDLEGRDPVDSVAARVLRSKGVKYVAHGDRQEVSQDTPIPTKPLPHTFRKEDDLTGLTNGKLTVIGLARDTRARWVCRCACGNYALRKSKAIKTPHSNPPLSCVECYSFAKAKDRHNFKLTGKYDD